MSTVLLGLDEPGFVVTTILWHQIAGVFAGSLSIIPMLTSLASPSSISCLQWSGTRYGLMWQTGVASGLIASLRAGPDIPGSFWWGQVLNVELWYLFRSHSLRRGPFASVAGNGSSVGGLGVSSLTGQPHGAKFSVVLAEQDSVFLCGYGHDCGRFPSSSRPT